MSTPTIIEIPHSLGREEAVRRMKARIGELASHIPGGVADVQASWPGEDRMALAVTALCQSISATLDVEDKRIRVALVLPPMLALFAGRIADVVRHKGATLLLG